MTTRRFFLTGAVSLLAAPAIVRAGSLMPVRSPRLVTVTLTGLPGFDLGYEIAEWHKKIAKEVGVPVAALFDCWTCTGNGLVTPL